MKDSRVDAQERRTVLIRPGTTLREAKARFPGIEVVLEKHGLTAAGGEADLDRPVGTLARAYGVDPAPLVGDLNAFAARQAGTVSLPLMERRPRVRIDLYVVGVLASLTLAIFGGFPLGIVVALGGARDIGLGERWSALVQSHGHLQIVGWVGLFIMGIAFHVLPRFKNTDLKLRALALPSLALVAAAALLRGAAQPWSDSSPVDLLLAGSAIVEVVGVACFAAIIAAMLLPKARKSYDRYLLAGCAWFVAAATANVVVVTELALDDQLVLGSQKTSPLLEMYLLGFVTLFILGVSARVLPHFLSLRTPSMSALTPALLGFNLALVVRVAAGWVAAYSSWSRPDWLAAATAYGIAVSVFAYIITLNLHRPSERDAAVAGFRGYERLIRAAYVWLLVAVAIEAWFGTRAVAGDFRPDFLEGGAARHALALGFVTQIMFGVGYRVLPVFSGKRLYSGLLVHATLILVNVAAITRVGHAIQPWGSAAFKFDHIAVAGGFAMLALLVFAYNILRTLFGRPAAAAAVAEGPPRQPQAPGRGRPVITEDTIVADLISQVPGALELLISKGLKQLADPEVRARVTPHATLRTACHRHGIDVKVLIRELEQLV